VTSDLDFKVMTFFEVEYLKKRRVLETKLLYDSNRKTIPSLSNGTTFNDFE